MLFRFCFFVFLAGAASALEFHVSPEGKAGVAGTKEDPFATMLQARDAVRTLKKKAPLNEAVTVWIHDGIYETSETLALDVIDSGTEKFTVVFRAVEGAKRRFMGAP